MTTGPGATIAPRKIHVEEPIEVALDPGNRERT
jgi:hypothetical protein